MVFLFFSLCFFIFNFSYWDKFMWSWILLILFFFFFYLVLVNTCILTHTNKVPSHGCSSGDRDDDDESILYSYGFTSYSLKYLLIGLMLDLDMIIHFDNAGLVFVEISTKFLSRNKTCWSLWSPLILYDTKRLRD